MKLNYKKYSIAGLAAVCCLTAVIALSWVAGRGGNERQNPSGDYSPADAKNAATAREIAVNGISAATADSKAAINTEYTAATADSKAAINTEYTAVEYVSAQREGIIGSYAGKSIDNPADNIFTLTIDRELSDHDKVRLVYELEGVEDFTCVAHSINDRLAKGGYLVKESGKSGLQRERLHPSWLKKGENRITFSLPENAGFGYKVKNLSVQVEKNAVTMPSLVVNTSQKAYGNKAYIRGFVQGTEEIYAMQVAGREVPLRDGEFETVVDLPANGKVTIAAIEENGNTLHRELVYGENAQADAVFELNHDIQQAGKTFFKGVSDRIELASAVLEVDSTGLLVASKDITLTTLRAIDLPALDMGMSNVTAQSKGYRFLPHGEHFSEGATVSIQYDRTKIPDGFTEDDIKTFYFDLASGHWVALERDTLDKANRLVVSRTTHFTDMINGVIQTPESPETQGFAPTMVSGIKAADPAAKVQLIAPPAANNRGSAGLSYAFEMPPARNGMQPGLGIRYNSDGGSGLLGEGWDLDVQSICVDTRWGVPRYNSEKETETYSMDGSMLVMMDESGQSAVAHRGDKINRVSDRRFYARQEGGFAKIIRKGSSPGNYTWDITDKSGTKYIYSAAGALKGSVKTLDGQTKEVISQWKLTRVEELHGDYIDYLYETVNEPVRGSLTAKAVYLKQIRAGNKGNDPHTVVSLVYRDSLKAKQTNSARYGFLNSNNRLLDRVEIRFENQLLRTYSFDYGQGAFHTEVLAAVKHLGPQGNLFAEHLMDYYDDVKSSQGYEPFQSEPETWNLHDDGLDAGFVNPVANLGVDGFSDKATALGGSVTTSTGGSFYAGVGPNNMDFTSKSMTGGGSVNYSGSTTKGLSTLIDINGDGLPDKVFVREGSVYYRPNISNITDTRVVYGNAIKVEGITKISQTKGSSTSGGLKAHPGYLNLTAVAGVDKSTSTSTTKVYFSDVNNDGLPDLVVNGKVYYNHMEQDSNGNLVPTFTLSSGDTPSPMMGGGVIDGSDTEVDEQEQAELIRNSPLLDAVRVWEAPFTGTVNITGNVQLQIPTGNYDTESYEKADGVRVAIQLGGTEKWAQTIAKGDVTVYQATVANTLIQKGQKIYFRLQSGDTEMANGAFDRVQWSPKITYTDRMNRINPDSLSTAVYTIEDAGFISVENPNYIPLTDTIYVSGHFEKPVTSDDITLRVVLSNNRINNDGSPNPAYREDTAYSREFRWDEVYDGELQFTVVNGINGENLLFSIEAQTNIAFHKVKWNPVTAYKIQGSSQSQPATVYYSLHAVQLHGGNPYVLSQDAYLRVQPQLLPKFPNTLPDGKFIVAVKNVTGLLAKKEISISNGVYTPNMIDSIEADAGDIWIEYYFADRDFLTKIDSARATLTAYKDSLTDMKTVEVNTFTSGSDTGFGPMYRGWGQFVYNAADGRYAHVIDESKLKLPENEDAQVDPLTMAFMPMIPDFYTKTYWIGQDPNTYIKNGIMSSSRLGEQDVVLTNPLENTGNEGEIAGTCLPGSGARGINLETKSSSTAVMTGVMGVTYSTSEGKSRTITSFMDMNGDGYPDIITPNQIQVTNTRGGFDSEIIRGIGNHRSESKSKSWGYGGNPVHAVSAIATAAKYIAASTEKKQAMLKQMESAKEAQRKEISENGAKAQPTFTGSLEVPWNEDWAVETFMDINGDGLPDKILSNRQVQLNLGYSFSEPIEWQLESLDRGKSLSTNAGAGFGVDYGASSFSAGFGLVTATSRTDYTFIDVNSDGLPDKVRRDGNNVYVSLNTGNGFSDETRWNQLEDINKAASTSESLNASYTYSFPVPPVIPVVKIALNGGMSRSKTMNRTLMDIRDVDGDGFPDIVKSDSENQMQVYRSTIARTNKLKSVRNPLGGSFLVDYSRSQATYDHPGGKWVMVSVEINDGLADDGANMKTLFDYSGGKHDRHQREFLGFARVETKNIDTEVTEADRVYRKVIQKYDVSSVYTASNELGTTVEDSAGNKYTESVNEYYSYRVTASGDSYAFTADSNVCTDRAIAFTPLKYTKSVVYEGQAEGMIANEIFYEYYLDGYSGELKTYTYSDKGTLGREGTGGYNYRTSIEYTGNPVKHIIGLPVRVQVKDDGGTLYRQTEAAYDLNYANHITKITQTLNIRGDRAVTDIEYDRYGNITKKTLPANSNGERMYYRYRYDRDYNMYVERVEDAFGYRSEMEDYDYRFGIPLVVRDMNGYTQETTLDDMGRITSVLAPNEQVVGAPYTISFEYQTPVASDSGTFTPLYAVTGHFDPQHPGNDIETVTFVDGLGRAVQVKKDGVVYENGADRTVMIVSGRAKFDAFGRVKEAYYPTVENTGTPTVFNAAFDDVAPTVTGYDILDRVTKTVLPDSSQSVMEYTKDNGGRMLVTTVTDAQGGRQAAFANGSGLTVKTEQYSGPDGTITTRFEFDPVNQLLKAIDNGGNETQSVYDLAGRRTEVTHPVSGTTAFTYDNAGNLLSRQTANLAAEGKAITYEYEYTRLRAITYPDHPENNVKYLYGNKNASHNRVGRLMLQQDGSGAQEFTYDRLGNVESVKRTLIIPNQAIATYVTRWKYDSWNRLEEMIYPDNEKITYSYNTGGLLESVKGEKAYSYNYVNKLGYDRFEQRVYMKYCNGVETDYSYDPQRRRLSNLSVNSTKTGMQIMDNAYSYDAVDNVLGVTNSAPLPSTGMGGQMSHTYGYDGLYRLVSATGTYAGNGQKTAGYTLEMAYDNLHNITGKKQHLQQQNVQFDGLLKAGYELTYHYTGNPFQISTLDDESYRSEEDTVNALTVKEHKYAYDANGNPVYVNTSREKKDGTRSGKNNERKLLWDEENRLEAIDDNGFVSNYWYDAAGERTVKTSGESEQMYVNSIFSGGNTATANFTAYVNAYMVVTKGGNYTKHIYIGSQRIVSKLGDLDSYGADPRRIEYAGAGVDGADIRYADKYTASQQTIKDRYRKFEVPYLGKDNDDYVNGGGFCCEDTAKKATATKANDNPELFQYYYHSDHLGSSNLITNLDGETVQHIEYVPFGEVFIEQRNNKWNTPYLFNAKELDRETGLYYYGARYYDPRVSLWLSCDPLQEKYPNISTYAYCIQNPVKYIDPDGREVKSVFNRETNKLYIMDLDHYKAGLPIKHVSAKDYQLGGIRDKDGNLTHNQVLVINNVFSGGQVENGSIVRDANDNRQKAIPKATYDIVDNNADTRHTGWFRLDRQDGSRYNDKDDVTGRDGYRFHLGGLSWGCVTVDRTQDDAETSWNVVTSILNSTSTTTVPEKRGKQWLNPWSNLTKYGTMEVKGADKIPYKPQEDK